MHPSRGVGYVRGSRAAVLHLYDPTDPRCPSIDLILKSIAGDHPGVQFVQYEGMDRAVAASVASIGQELADDAEVGRGGLPVLVAFVEAS